MDRPERLTDTPNPPSLRQLLPGLLVLLLGLTLGAAALYWYAQQSAEREAARWGESLGRSTSILVQPLLLADDRISLNYLFNELQSNPLLNGLKLTDPQQLVVAVSGRESGTLRTLVLTRGEDTLGELSLWINSAPLLAPLRQQLLYAALVAAGALLLALLVLGYRLRKAAQPPQQTPQYQEVAAAFYPPPADAGEATAQADAIDSAPSADLSPSADDAPLDLSILQQEADVDERDTEARPVEATDIETAAIDERRVAESAAAETRTDTAAPAPADQRNPRAVDSDSNADLVELLKPDHHAPQMPHFMPSERAPEADGDDVIAPEIEQVEFDDDEEASHAGEPTPAKPKLSLVSSPLQGRDEEQLGLYTLEHELELLLAPQEAGYLFLIDTTSAHADNIEENERSTLLRHYRTLANSAAHIYSGRVETLPQGDLQLYFDQPAEDDSHGINALCSALLFTGLYKQYNQHRIRQFKPVMNLHMSVVRGRLDRPERLLEEARFLTRTTQTNELISHTALTEAPELKESLLEGADIRREDEDKVLIIRVSRSYQELLDKQARYLLSKLLNREQEQPPTPAES